MDDAPALRPAPWQATPIPTASARSPAPPTAAARRPPTTPPPIPPAAGARPPTPLPSSTLRRHGRARRPGSASRSCSTRKRCTATWRPKQPASRRRSPWRAASTPISSSASPPSSAAEVRAHGTVLALSPVVDIARDPRWGPHRGKPSGEDPYVCAELGVGRGARACKAEGKELAPRQGLRDIETHDRSWPAPRRQQWSRLALLGERRPARLFLPALPRRGRAHRHRPPSCRATTRSTASPAIANKWLLKDVLRGEWGLSMAPSSRTMPRIGELNTFHHVAANMGEASRLALEAGVDCDLPDGEAYRTLAGRSARRARAAGAGRQGSARICCA